MSQKNRINEYLNKIDKLIFKKLRTSMEGYKKPERCTIHTMDYYQAIKINLTLQAYR